MSHRTTSPWIILIALSLAALMPSPFWLAALAIAGVAGLGIVIWFSFSRLVEIVAANRFDRPDDERDRPSCVDIKRCRLTRRLDRSKLSIVVEVECENVAPSSVSDLHADLAVKVCTRLSEIWITGEMHARELASLQTCTFSLSKEFTDRIDLEDTAHWYEIDGTVAYQTASGERQEKDFTYQNVSHKIDGTIELQSLSSRPALLQRDLSLEFSRDVRGTGCEST